MVLFLVKRTKINTPSIQNFKFLTLDQKGRLLSVKRKNKRLLSNFEGWNLKKFKELEVWGMCQVALKNVNAFSKYVFINGITINFQALSLKSQSTEVN